MNLGCYLVILNTIMLIISIKTETPSIQALLIKKWRISEKMELCRERTKTENALQLSPNLQKEFCSYLMQSNENEVLPMVSKKSKVEYSFCRCDSYTSIRNLGEGFYPRHITEHKCQTKKCCEYGRCREIVYSVRVLKLRNSDEMEDDSVPGLLRHCFNFSTVNITIACQCS